MRHLDPVVFHLINGWCGNRLLDQIAAFEEAGTLFRGGLLLIPYWWFWFSPEGNDRDRRRRIVVGALLGTLGALLLARSAAAMLPFRPRPMYESGVGFHPPSFQIAMNMENWSSFPSDTATLFFALSFGILRLSRPLGAALMIFSAVWICLPRIYLGIHYPSDILAGASLGIAVSWAPIAAMEARGSALGRCIMEPLLLLEAQRPKGFYAAAFTLTFGIATMFDDLRAIGRAGMRWLRNGTPLGMEAVAVVGCSVLMALVAITVLRRRRSRDRAAGTLRASGL